MYAFETKVYAFKIKYKQLIYSDNHSTIIVKGPL